MKRRPTNRMGWMWVIGLVVVCVAFARFVLSDDSSADAPTEASDAESSVSVAASTSSQPAPQRGSQEVAAASNFDVNSYLTTGGEVPESTADEPSGAFRTLCTFSHLAYDDPIVYPGQPGKSHLHMFFGNASADADSTYESLRAGGGGSCQGGPINRTGYWAPAMFDAAGKVVVPDDLIVYYKGEYADSAGITSIAELPPGLRMIAGYNMTGSPDTQSHFDWYCEVNQVKQQSIPHCADGERVGVQLRFPQCWDGVHLDSVDHRSHLAHISYDTGVAACPAGYPVHIPEITLAIWWTQDGDSEEWHLSSDHMPGMTRANGSTFHSDWFGAWDPIIQDRWLNECIRAMRNCIDGELGDGSKLAQLDAYKGPMLLDPPPSPS